MSRTWVDVSRRLAGGVPVWPGDTPFAVETRREGDLTVSRLVTTCHVGTHIETGRHVDPDGPFLDGVPLSTLCGDAEVVRVGLRGRTLVEPRDLPEGWEPGAPRILFATGTFPPGTAAIEPGFAGLAPGLVDRLAGWKVVLVGIDTPSVDPMDAGDLPAHHALARHGMVWIEGLELSGIPEGPCEMVALPLPLGGTEAAPARVVLRCARLGS